MAKKIMIIFLSLGIILYLISPPKEISLTRVQREDMDAYKKQEENTNLFGILKIPTINIENPIYQKGTPQNNVDENIELLEETISKNKQYYIVLASHSGTGSHAYFKNLEQLKIADKIYLTYQNNTYEYTLIKKEEVPKVGEIEITQYDFSYIVLITCSKTKEDKQEVYYAKLDEKINKKQNL